MSQVNLFLISSFVLSSYWAFNTAVPATIHQLLSIPDGNTVRKWINQKNANMLLPLPHLAIHLFMYCFSSIRPARLPTEPWSHIPSQLSFFLLESPSFTFLQGIAKVIQIYFSTLYQGVDWTFCPSICTFHLTPFSSKLLLYLLPRQAFITSPPRVFYSNFPWILSPVFSSLLAITNTHRGCIIF